jgi:DNA-binding transcriptional MerR regulator
MSSDSRDAEPRYGIGAVSKITGLSDHTIRVWERRYGAVVAERAANGRRLFTAVDIEKLSLLKALTERGLSISRIASESNDELRGRIEDLRVVAEVPVASRWRAAVFGDLLAAQVSDWGTDLDPLEIVIADSNRDRFIADLERRRVDLLIYESAILDEERLVDVLDLLGAAGALKAVVVYTFCRREDLRRAAEAGVILLRAPIGQEEIRSALLRESMPSKVARAEGGESRRQDYVVESGSPAELTARRFNSRQLSALASTATEIECECPRHLAQLVADLSAFEIYSSRCASRDDDDAALHHFLHRTTAQARSLVESALQKVIDVEGLDCGD